MAQSDFPKTLTHKNGSERVVTTKAEQVAAKFDGYAELTSGQKAARTRAAKAPAKKTAAKRTAAPAGGPAAKATTAPAKKAAATETPAI